MVIFLFVYHLLSLCVYMCVGVHACMCMWCLCSSHGPVVNIRKQLASIGSLYSPCRSWGLCSEPQAWQQAPGPTETSHQPLSSADFSFSTIPSTCVRTTLRKSCLIIHSIIDIIIEPWFLILIQEL